MKTSTWVVVLAGSLLLLPPSVTRGQITGFSLLPERQFGLSRDVTGKLTVSNVFTNGCPVGPALLPTFNMLATLTGTIAANDKCDELGAVISPNATFHAFWYSDVRGGDWRGWHSGYFKITDGGVTVAFGTMAGSLGVGSHRGLEDCAACNHIEGTLRGWLYGSASFLGARIQATYAGDVTDTTCPSPSIPQGAFELAIDGVVVSHNCPPTVGP
jgi:hypothetical protein